MVGVMRRIAAWVLAANPTVWGIGFALALDGERCAPAEVENDRRTLGLEMKTSSTGWNEARNSAGFRAAPDPGQYAVTDRLGVFMSKPAITVAKYLEQQLAICGRPQKEIAADCGYPNANIITMFKKGSSKLPIEKVGLMAGALGSDPAYLLQLTMVEYHPEAWREIEAILGSDRIITQNEFSLVKLIRQHAEGGPIDMGIAENQRTVAETVASMASRDSARAKAAVDAIEKLPSNGRHKT